MAWRMLDRVEFTRDEDVFGLEPRVGCDATKVVRTLAREPSIYITLPTGVSSILVEAVNRAKSTGRETGERSLTRSTQLVCLNDWMALKSA